MEMLEKTLVRLFVTSPMLAAEDITKRIGLAPDVSWKTGDKHPKVKVHHKNNGWCVQSEFDDKTTLESKVGLLLARITPFTRAIFEISAETEVLFSCVVYTDHRPTLFFDKRTMVSITALGASFDIDLYILPEITGE